MTNHSSGKSFASTVILPVSGSTTFRDFFPPTFSVK